VDGYVATYNSDMAMADNTLLAWEMDGAPIDAEPPLRMCPGGGTSEMYVKLVSSINVAALSPDQVTTTAVPVETYYPDNWTFPPQPPVYTTQYYPVHTTQYTHTAAPTAPTAPTVTSTVSAETYPTTEPTTTESTTMTTTAASRTTRPMPTFVLPTTVGTTVRTTTERPSSDY
jgi:hypothetical protein